MTRTPPPSALQLLAYLPDGQTGVTLDTLTARTGSPNLRTSLRHLRRAGLASTDPAGRWRRTPTGTTLLAA